MIEKFRNILSKERVLEGEKLKNHTTFKVGGPAKVLLIVENLQELVKVLEVIREYKEEFFLIGNGSNLLVSDDGFNGVVIKLSGDFSMVHSEGTRITAGGGTMLVKACTIARDRGLTGLEFAYGIPGTIGGAMVMNAGAYGGEMKDVVENVTILNSNLETKVYSLEDMEFGYRKSVLKREFGIVLEITFRLNEGDQEVISATMNEIMGKRKAKQPLEYPSAGSTFKRPEGAFAGKLIEDAGLKGYRVGGACVSEKHCGFVVNDKNGTASDINLLMNEVTRIVKENSGFELEPEVIKIGNFN